MKPRVVLAVLFSCLVLALAWVGLDRLVAQDDRRDPDARRVEDISPPESCVRVAVATDSFADWLRQLPLKLPSSRIRLYDGSRKILQGALHRVIDLEIGKSDLQQCADVVMRLRSDYLRSVGRLDEIAFNFTSGDRACYLDWIEGYRPAVKGNDVSWLKRAAPDSSERAYNDYLKTVFMYAGTYSLSRELHLVSDAENIRAGDCFIQGGFPGHAMIVLDIVTDPATDDKLMLLAQGYTPAQDIHIVRNPNDDALSPWYRVGAGDRLVTPEWTFDWSEVYRFPVSSVATRSN